MDNLQFTRNEIMRLADKLDSVAHEFTETEREVLLAIFATAAAQAGNGPDKTIGTLPAAEVGGSPAKGAAPIGENPAGLRDQLLNAYLPGPPPSISWSIKVTPPPAPVRAPDSGQY